MLGMTRLIAGRYRLVAELGRGGMGIVWKAWDERLKRHVAVKELALPQDPDHPGRGETEQRFLREARAAAALDHPHIISVYDVIEEPGEPVFLVMRYVPGRSLQEVAPLPPDRVRVLGLALLDALETAHGQGIVHRDVKPANVLITDTGHAVLADFGIAAVADATHSLTRTGLVVGSLGYIAPERFSSGTVGPESDLWSLGATLYYAVEGKRAYRADDGMEVHIARLMMGEDPEMNRAGPLAPVIAGLMEKNPARRWDHDRARRALNGESTGPTRSLPPVRRWAASRAARLLAALSLSLVLVGAIAYSAAGHRGPERPGPRGSATPAAGVYKRMPDFCGYLKRNDLRGRRELAADDLLDKSNNSREANCGWKSSGSPVQFTLIISAELYGSEAAAVREMANHTLGRSSSGVSADNPTVTSRVEGLAEEAVKSVFDESRGKRGRHNSTVVWFRRDNLIVSAHYMQFEVAPSGEADPKGMTSERALKIAGMLDGFLRDEPENQEEPIRG